MVGATLVAPMARSIDDINLRAVNYSMARPMPRVAPRRSIIGCGAPPGNIDTLLITETERGIASVYAFQCFSRKAAA
jgi:hypothetical protein